MLLIILQFIFFSINLILMGIRYRMLLLNLLFDFDDLLLEILFLLLIFKFEGLLSNQNELK